MSDLLLTKLYIPSSSGTIIRKELLNILDSMLEGNCPLTLISAPAGYGKTTVVSQWIFKKGLKTTWLSLDENDNDTLLFLKYLLAALQKIEDRVGENITPILKGLKLPPLENLLIELINDISNLSEDFILVIDDYHYIENKEIHEIIEFIIENKPTQIKIILISRQDPPLNLSRLRLNGLVELRSDNLRFSSVGINEFLKLGNIEIDSNGLRLLEQKTEGWPAVLKLASLSMKKQKDNGIEKFIKNLSLSNRFIIEYLMEEIIDGLNEAVRDFLILTSILKRFNAGLCNAVTNSNNASEVMEGLLSDNLFLVSLDNIGEWYRYHHLFANFLQLNIDESKLEVLHERASTFLESKGLYEEALIYAVRTNNIEMIERLFLKTIPNFIKTGEIEALYNWYSRLPGEVLVKSGEISTFKAWLLFFTGRVEQAATYLKKLKKQLKAGNTSDNVKGRLLSLEGFMEARKDPTAGLKKVKESLVLIDSKDLLLRALTMQSIGQIKSGMGDITGAVRFFKQAYSEIQECDYGLINLNSIINLVRNLNLQGKRNEAVLLCKNNIDRYVDSGYPYQIIYVVYGIVKYENNQLDEAKDLLEKGINICEKLGLYHVAGTAVAMLARCYAASTEIDVAVKLINDYKEKTQAQNMSLSQPYLDVLRASFSLKQGYLKPVEDWVKNNDINKFLSPTFEYFYLTYIRYLIKIAEYHKSAELLSNLRESLERGGCNGPLLSICILQAINYKKSGYDEKALDSLRVAVEIAAPEGYYRRFLDEDSRINELLLPIKEMAPMFIDKLYTYANFHVEQDLIDPLTDREMEILDLIAAGNTNKDIAEKLYISVGTVKWHISNIYSKLDVKKRTQAVKKGKNLGLI